jgi:hypothetical protein
MQRKLVPWLLLRSAMQSVRANCAIRGLFHRSSLIAHSPMPVRARPVVMAHAQRLNKAALVLM